MTVAQTDLITTIPQQPNGQPGVLAQQVPVSQLTSGLPAQYNAIAGNTPLTLTAQQISGANGVYINLTATLAGAGTVTTPTAAQIIAALPNPLVGTSYEMRIINSSGGAFAWTLAAGTGVTLSGTMTMAQNTYRDFVITITSATTVTIQSVGTGTQS